MSTSTQPRVRKMAQRAAQSPDKFVDLPFGSVGTLRTYFDKTTGSIDIWSILRAGRNDNFNNFCDWRDLVQYQHAQAHVNHAFPSITFRNLYVLISPDGNIAKKVRTDACQAIAHPMMGLCLADLYLRRKEADLQALGTSLLRLLDDWTSDATKPDALREYVDSVISYLALANTSNMRVMRQPFVPGLDETRLSVYTRRLVGAGAITGQAAVMNNPGWTPTINIKLPNTLASLPLPQAPAALTAPTDQPTPAPAATTPPVDTAPTAAVDTTPPTTVAADPAPAPAPAPAVNPIDQVVVPTAVILPRVHQPSPKQRRERVFPPTPPDIRWADQISQRIEAFIEQTRTSGGTISPRVIRAIYHDCYEELDNVLGCGNFYRLHETALRRVREQQQAGTPVDQTSLILARYPSHLEILRDSDDPTQRLAYTMYQIVCKYAVLADDHLYSDIRHEGQQTGSGPDGARTGGQGHSGGMAS